MNSIPNIIAGTKFEKYLEGIKGMQGHKSPSRICSSSFIFPLQFNMKLVKMITMTYKQITSTNYRPLMKRAAICFFILAVLFFIFNTSSQQQQQQNPQKLPASVSQTLIHYATSKTTPQQTLKEISVTENVLRRKSPCNFLVFGLGHDSLLWSSLNSGGRTIFLDENPAWIDRMRAEFPNLESFHVSYDTKLPQADELLRSAQSDPAACGAVVDPRDSKCALALKSLPREVYEVEWDVIMVDAPTGYHDEAPGRMTAIYTVGLLARNRRSGGETDVMVHDVDRPVEDRFSRAFLCEGYLKEEEGKLRHFVVPSYRDRRPGSTLCP